MCNTLIPFSFPHPYRVQTVVNPQWWWVWFHVHHGIFLPYLAMKMNKKNTTRAAPYTPPRPLTRDVGPTSLRTPVGGEWVQYVGSHYREGMALTSVKWSAGSQSAVKLYSKCFLPLRSYYKNAYNWEIGQFYVVASKLSKDHHRHVSALLHANHQWQKNPLKNPEVRLAA